MWWPEQEWEWSPVRRPVSLIEICRVAILRLTNWIQLVGQQVAVHLIHTELNQESEEGAQAVLLPLAPGGVTSPSQDSRHEDRE